jgi:hypothetical protein
MEVQDDAQRWRLLVHDNHAIADGGARIQELAEVRDFRLEAVL